MNPLKLYIENFMCHYKSLIDFTQFSTALIVGKISNNDLYSNGVGKTTIFKAIEYVLFNQADVNLEKIIRDDTTSCKVIFDFESLKTIYRVSRSRSRKGNSDLSLYERTSNIGTDDEINNSESDPRFWKDISSRRSSDTEKDLAKLIKINFKSFRSTVHFMQNDFSGLTTSTPEKRKGILKDALNLLVYLKLEKIAKDKASGMSKNIDKHKTLIDVLGDPDRELPLLQDQLNSINAIIQSHNNDLRKMHVELNNATDILNKSKEIYSSLEGKTSNLLIKQQSLISDKRKIESSVKEYKSKKNNISANASELIASIADLKDKQLELAKIDYSEIDILLSKIDLLKNKIAQLNGLIQNKILQYEELKIPVPDENKCKHCRQLLSEAHKLNCKKIIADEMTQYQLVIKDSKKEISNINNEIVIHQQKINSLNLHKQQLELININITSSNKEVKDKQVIFKEYSALLIKFQDELNAKIDELTIVEDDLKKSSLDEANILKDKIDKDNQIVLQISNKILNINKEISHQSGTAAVLDHSIVQKTKDNDKRKILSKELLLLEDTYKIYPLAIQAFSSTGIPNLIIQDVLDDLQVEANDLLSKLKPGLQLTFSIEKTKGDGSQDETLDIQYFVNGKSREYDQLSGAMKLAVTFSLKLGLSFLLQKMIGTNIKLLMLDEIDQSLDKASVDAFSDIVKFFQNEFTILIITHNDRLKDKFSHAILVEQDMNMISTASVVSSW